MDALKNILLAVSVLGVTILGWHAVTVKPVVVQTSKPNIGALSGPDIPFQYISVGGVPTYSQRTTALVSATTTPMAIQSPAATSTLLLGSGCRLDTASTTAKAVRFAKATTAFATTTFLFGGNIAASSPGTVVATTSADAFVFGPNQWLVMSLVGGAGVDSPTGTCQAQFLAY